MRSMNGAQNSWSMSMATEPTSPPESPAGEHQGGNPLTRKLGPLPAWGWALGIGGAVIAVRLLRSGSAFPSEGGTSSTVGAVNPTIPGSEQSTFANYSASDVATLAAALKAAGLSLNPAAPTAAPQSCPPGFSMVNGKCAPLGIHAPSTAPAPATKVDFAGTISPFGTRYPSYVHTLADALAWINRAIHNGYKVTGPIPTASTVPHP